jgi:hypothetical protein
LNQQKNRVEGGLGANRLTVDGYGLDQSKNIMVGRPSPTCWGLANDSGKSAEKKSRVFLKKRHDSWPSDQKSVELLAGGLNKPKSCLKDIYLKKLSETKKKFNEIKSDIVYYNQIENVYINK